MPSVQNGLGGWIQITATKDMRTGKRMLKITMVTTEHARSHEMKWPVDNAIELADAIYETLGVVKERDRKYGVDCKIDADTTSEKLHPRQDELLANAGVTELPPPPAEIHVDPICATPHGWDSVEGGVVVEEEFVDIDDAYDEPALWLTEAAALAGGIAYQEQCLDRWPRPLFQVRPRRKKIDNIDGWACDIVNTQRDNACAHTIMAFEWRR